MLHDTWNKDNKVRKNLGGKFAILKKCKSKLNNFIYEMLFIRNLTDHFLTLMETVDLLTHAKYRTKGKILVRLQSCFDKPMYYKLSFLWS